MSYDTSDIDIKVQVKLSESRKLLATASVILFDGLIEIHGWRISTSTYLHEKFQELIWIQPPSYNSFGHWRNIVFIKDKTLHEKILDQIYDKYHKVKSQSPPLNDL